MTIDVDMAGRLSLLASPQGGLHCARRKHAQRTWGVSLPLDLEQDRLLFCKQVLLLGEFSGHSCDGRAGVV